MKENQLRELSCKEAAKLLSLKRDRDLSENETVEMKEHLAACLNCQNFDRQLDVLAELARRYAGGKG